MALLKISSSIIGRMALLKISFFYNVRMALLKDAGDNWIVDREGQSVVLQAQPVKAMRSRKTRSGPGPEI